MHPYPSFPSVAAGGDISPCRIVKLSTAADFTVLQGAAASDMLVGICQEGARDAPGLSGASALAAAAGDDITVYGPGSNDVLVEVGSGGITRGARLTSDSVGKAVVATAATAGAVPTTTVIAFALESAAAGEFARVMVISPFKF